LLQKYALPQQEMNFMVPLKMLQSGFLKIN